MGFFSDVDNFSEQSTKTSSGKTEKEPLGGILDEDISDFIAEMQEDSDEWDDDKEYGNDSDENFDEYGNPEDYLGDSYFDDGGSDDGPEEDGLKGSASEPDIDFIDEPIRREVSKKFIKKPNPEEKATDIITDKPDKPKTEKIDKPKTEKKSAIKPQETLIAQDTELVGTGMLVCKTGLTVGGIFSQQELKCRNFIRICETGAVNAKQIDCESILVMGNVKCGEKITAKTVEILDGGCIIGNVECTEITVNKGGTIIGQINASENITVLCGAVKGNLTSGKKIKIAKGSLIKGDISSPEIVISEGVRILGTCIYTDNSVDDFFNESTGDKEQKTAKKQKGADK